MEFLTVSACADGGHEDVFGCHEGEFRHDVLFDDLRPNLHSVRHICDEGEDDVCSEEGFGQGEPAVRGVVERAFKPLHGVSLRGVERQVHEVAGERTDSFGAHGVALVRHCAGADLVFLERLFDFLEVCEQTDVSGEFVCGLRDSGERGEHEVVDLA